MQNQLDVALRIVYDGFERRGTDIVSLVLGSEM